MSKSDFPSVVTIGRNTDNLSVFEFLSTRFPKISQTVWRARISSGSVLFENNMPVLIQDIAKPGTKIYYYREVENEAEIPFIEKILFQNEHILVVDKPHFLQVSPAGKFANETLLNRLKKSTGIEDITPVNRLDRDTAGLVLFSINRETRDSYYNLFRERSVYKSYRCISKENPAVKETGWRIENRLAKGEPWFRMKPTEGISNAVTNIKLDRQENGFCYFTLVPGTGQKHQLRIHMCLIGFPILNDRYYPELQPEDADDFSRPLKLHAEKLRFIDPLSGKSMEFQSKQNL
jgi:tRNA pseudouridine32 synthase / 23S rRNA pseudouridine746 synthase